MKALVKLTSTAEKASPPWFRRLTILVELLINFPPSRESAEITVIDEEVCIDLATHVCRVGSFFWVRAVHCIRLYTTVYHELVCFLECAAVSVRPKYNTMTVVLEHLNGFYSKRLGLTYLWVSVFNNSAVEIYCYEEALTHP